MYQQTLPKTETKEIFELELKAYKLLSIPKKENKKNKPKGTKEVRKKDFFSEKEKSNKKELPLFLK